MKDYKSALNHYEKYLGLEEALKTGLFDSENLKIAIVLDKLGQRARAKQFVEGFVTFTGKDNSMYLHLHLAEYYAYQKNNEKAIEHLRLFAIENNFQYRTLFIDTDPVFEDIKNLPEFSEVMRSIDRKLENAREELKFYIQKHPLPNN